MTSILLCDNRLLALLSLGGFMCLWTCHWTSCNFWHYYTEFFKNAPGKGEKYLQLSVLWNLLNTLLPYCLKTVVQVSSSLRFGTNNFWPRISWISPGLGPSAILDGKLESPDPSIILSVNSKKFPLQLSWLPMDGLISNLVCGFI